VSEQKRPDWLPDGGPPVDYERIQELEAKIMELNAGGPHYATAVSQPEAGLTRETYWCGCRRWLRVERCEQHADLEVDDDVPPQTTTQKARKSAYAEAAKDPAFMADMGAVAGEAVADELNRANLAQAAELESARAELAALRADKERLDWLGREGDWVRVSALARGVNAGPISGSTLREAIDAARHTESEGE